MTSLPEQLSAASTRQISAQLDAQFRMFNTFATQALENTSRLVSLHLSASRDSVERSSQTLRQLAQATQPRDLLVLRSHTEEEVRSLFNYGRELFNITANAQPYGLRTILQTAQPAAAVAAVAEAAAEAVHETAKAADDTAHAVADVVADVVADTVAAAAPASVAPVAPEPEPVAEPAPAPVEAQAAPEAPVAPEAQAAPEAPAAPDAPVAEEAPETAGVAAEPAEPAEPVTAPQEEPQGASAEAQARVSDEPELARQKPIARAAGKGAPKAAAAAQPMAAPVEGKDSAKVTRITTSSKRRK